MQTDIAKVTGYIERETITGKLRTRLVHLDYPLEITDGDGLTHFIWAGCTVLVVDRIDTELALVEQLVDLAELSLHFRWSRNHHGQETRTPLDLRTPQNGGREDEPIPF